MAETCSPVFYRHGAPYVRCLSCRSKYRLAPEHAGRKGICKVCGAVVRVPEDLAPAPENAELGVLRPGAESALHGAGLAADTVTLTGSGLWANAPQSLPESSARESPAHPPPRAENSAEGTPAAAIPLEESVAAGANAAEAPPPPPASPEHEENPTGISMEDAPIAGPEVPVGGDGELRLKEAGADADTIESMPTPFFPSTSETDRLLPGPAKGGPASADSTPDSDLVSLMAGASPEGRSPSVAASSPEDPAETGVSGETGISGETGVYGATRDSILTGSAGTECSAPAESAVADGAEESQTDPAAGAAQALADDDPLAEPSTADEIRSELDAIRSMVDRMDAEGARRGTAERAGSSRDAMLKSWEQRLRELLAAVDRKDPEEGERPEPNIPRPRMALEDLMQGLQSGEISGSAAESRIAAAEPGPRDSDTPRSGSEASGESAPRTIPPPGAKEGDPFAAGEGAPQGGEGQPGAIPVVLPGASGPFSTIPPPWAGRAPARPVLYPEMRFPPDERSAGLGRSAELRNGAMRKLLFVLFCLAGLGALLWVLFGLESRPGALGSGSATLRVGGQLAPDLESALPSDPSDPAALLAARRDGPAGKSSRGEDAQGGTGALGLYRPCELAFGEGRFDDCLRLGKHLLDLGKSDSEDLVLKMMSLSLGEGAVLAPRSPEFQRDIEGLSPLRRLAVEAADGQAQEVKTELARWTIGVSEVVAVSLGHSAVEDGIDRKVLDVQMFVKVGARDNPALQVDLQLARRKGALSASELRRHTAYLQGARETVRATFRRGAERWEIVSLKGVASPQPSPESGL